MLMTRFLDEDYLWIAVPRGIFDIELANEILTFIEVKEMEMAKGFNRFCDLTQLDGVNLSASAVDAIATRRNLFRPNMLPVKSAFLAHNPLAIGIVFMYKALLESERIEVKVFRTLEMAADWLGVSKSKLVL